MSGETAVVEAPNVCHVCGLPAREGEGFHKGATMGFHADPFICAQRLRDALDERETELAAALVVVRAARILRVRIWQLNRVNGDGKEMYAACNTLADADFDAFGRALENYVRGRGK